MTNIYDVFGSKEQEISGITLDYGDFGFKVARAGGTNKKYLTAVNKYLKPYQRGVKLNALDDDKFRELIAKVYADAVILEWWGIQGKDGKAMLFSKENCIKLMCDLPDLFNDIIDQASEVSNFKQQEVEDAKKP